MKKSDKCRKKTKQKLTIIRRKGFPGCSDGKVCLQCRRRVQSLGQEYPLEKEMAIHSSTLAWKIPWTEEPDGLQSMSIELLMLTNNLILCRPLLLLPSIFPRIRVFFNESAVHIRWPKYWSLASALVLPMSILGWFPLRLTDYKIDNKLIT